MRKILLINPNTSDDTTAMMVQSASQVSAPGTIIVGATAAQGERMIINQAGLERAARGVAKTIKGRPTDIHGIIIGAFGDPGLEEARALSTVPVVGICEASVMEACRARLRFGIATTTPGLVDAIERSMDHYGVRSFYTGTRLTHGDPEALTARPTDLLHALTTAVALCLQDGAEAVIIGGGPLANAAQELSKRVGRIIISPVHAAVLSIERTLGAAQPRVPHTDSAV